MAECAFKGAKCNNNNNTHPPNNPTAFHTSTFTGERNNSVVNTILRY